MPLKAAKFGIKYFELCESSTGYVYNYFVYLDSATTFDSVFLDMPFTSQVVIQLSKDLFFKGYRIKMDNYFTSAKLFEYLILRRTDCLVTIRIKWIGVPKKVKETVVKKNEHKIMYRGK